MSQTIKRKASSARKAAAAQGTARKVRVARERTGSALDGVMAWLPFSEAQLHRVFVGTILGGAAALAWVVAGLAGPEDQPLVRQLLVHFGVQDVAALAKIAAGMAALPYETFVYTYGEFAPALTVAAEAGAPLAQAICDEAAAAMALSIRLVGSRFAAENPADVVPVALIGVRALFWLVLTWLATWIVMYFTGATGLECSVRGGATWRALLRAMLSSFWVAVQRFALFGVPAGFFAVLLLEALLQHARH